MPSVTANLILFLSLLGLAALWPPYNIFIARALEEGDYLTVVLTPLVSTLGLSIITVALALGAGLTNLPLSPLGGAFVGLMGLRMLMRKSVEGSEGLAVGERAEILGTAFLVSATPGVYSVTAAVGVERGDFLLILLVFMAGPILGITLGGFALHHGLKATRLPLSRIGGLILTAIGLWMVLSWIWEGPRNVEAFTLSWSTISGHGG
jgi:hypothetical protein